MKEEDVGSFVPGVVLRCLRMRCVPDGGVEYQPPVCKDCILWALCAFSDRLMDSP